MQNADVSFNNFYKAINAVLAKHAPYQKIKKHAFKTNKRKPQITTVIQNSIKIKNKLYKNYITKKDIPLKKILPEYKEYSHIPSQHLEIVKRNTMITFS